MMEPYLRLLYPTVTWKVTNVSDVHHFIMTRDGHTARFQIDHEDPMSVLDTAFVHDKITRMIADLLTDIEEDNNMAQMPDTWIEATQDLSDEGIAKLNKGEVLFFNVDGKREEYKVVRISRTQSRIWIEPVKLYDLDEVEVQTVKPTDDESKTGLPPHTTRDVTEE